MIGKSTARLLDRMQTIRAAESAEAELTTAEELPHSSSKQSTAIVLHARMCCTLVAILAEQAPETFRGNEAAVRTVLLPVLQCTAWPNTAVSSQAVTAMDNLCRGATTWLPGQN
jgi:hypothetical protein